MDLEIIATERDLAGNICSSIGNMHTINLLLNNVQTPNSTARVSEIL